MKKPGVLAASLLTASLFAVGLAVVAHHALAPGAAPELVETANAAEVRAAAPETQPRAAASGARSTGADRAVAADAEKTSAARIYRSAMRGKSIGAGRSYSDDDDDDDDDDD